MPQLAFLSAWHRNFALHVDLAVQGFEPLHLSAAEVADEYLCQLGRWLAENAVRLGGRHAFSALKALHATYHEQAGRVIRAHLADAPVQLAVDRLHEISAQVIEAIHVLDAELRADSEPGIEAPVAASFWDDALLIGHEVLDEQHKAIARFGDQVLRNPGLSLGSDAGTCFLHDFYKLVALHFETEELAMCRMSLPEDLRKRHFEEHSRLLDQIVSYSVDFTRSGRQLSAGDITQDIFGIIIDHVVKFDLSLRPEVLSRH